jgi:hypothetical protein
VCPNITNRGADCFVCSCGGEPCAKGKYGLRGIGANHTCGTCARGQFQDVPGAEGANSCKSCAAATGQVFRDAEPASVSKADCVQIICGTGQQPLLPLVSHMGTEGLQCENCTAGRHKAGRSATSCESCPCGQWQDLPGQGTCGTACAAGTFGNATTGQCENCPSDGFFCLAAQKVPFSRAAHCIPGEHELFAPNATSDRVCAPCAPGTSSNKSNDEENVAECVPCPANTFQPAAGKGFCLPYAVCAKGERVASAPNATADRTCAPCLAMHFSATSNAAVCERCPGGKFQDAQGQPFCETCSEGSVCRADKNTGIVEKQECPAGFSCSGTRVERCVNQISKPTTGKCASCEDKEFANTITNMCAKCPRLRENNSSLALGVVCSGGGIRIEDDIFVVPDGRAISAHAATLRCRELGVCKTAVDNLTFVARTVCQLNTTGLLCGLCEPGSGKAAGHCVPCPSADVQALVTWVFVLGALGVSLAMTKKSLNPDFEGATVTVIRITISFLFMTGFMSQLQLDWGNVLRQLFNFAKASSGGLPPFIDCAGVSFEMEMAVSQLLPLVVPTLPLVVLGAWALLQRARKRSTAQIWGVDKQHFYTNASVAISYLLWPMFVVQNLRILNCSVEVGEKRFVASALQVQCDVGEHARLKTVAIVELVVFVPTLPALLLYRLRKGCDVSEGSWNRTHLYFLFGGFRPGYAYWEAIVLARKFAVLAIGVFLADNTFGLQVTACMWVVAAATVLQLLCKPYQHRTEERLETLSLGGTTIAMMIGQVIHQADGADGLGYSVLAACQGCVITILLFTMCCFGAFFVGEVLAARRAKKEAKARDNFLAGDGGAAPAADGQGLGAGTTSQNHLPTTGSEFAVANPMELSGAAKASLAQQGSTQSWKDIGVSMVSETGRSGRAAAQRIADSPAAIALPRASSQHCKL